MCVTIYGSKADFRAAMRNPHDSSRAHAICRRLTGARQNSHWYGAFYWAACAVTSHEADLGAAYRYGFERFKQEVHRLPASQRFNYLRLYAMAWGRCLKIKDEAMALATSVLW